MDVVELRPVHRGEHHVGAHEVEARLRDRRHPRRAAFQPHAERHLAGVESLKKSGHGYSICSLSFAVTLAHFTISLFMCAANSSGVPPMTSAPCDAALSRKSCVLRMPAASR